MPAQAAMLVELSSIPPAPSGEEDAVPDGLAARVASGPGFWTDWLAEPDRQGLLEDLLADGVIARALREAPTGHRYDRVLRAVGCYLSGRHHRGRLLRSFSPCSRRRASRSAMHRDGCWRAGCSSDMCAAMPTSPPRASSPAQLTAALHMRGLVDGLDHLETSGSSPAWPSSEWPTGPVP